MIQVATENQSFQWEDKRSQADHHKHYKSDLRLLDEYQIGVYTWL